MHQEIFTDPFALSFNGLTNTPFPSLISLFKSGVEKVLGLSQMTQKYHEALQQSHSGESFYDTTLQVMNCKYEVEGMEYIPQEGGVIIVANHPLGGMEGVMLGSLLGRKRNDFRIMANSLLERIPEFRETMIFVNPFGGNDAVKQNLKGLKEAVHWVREGGILGIFPAGEVSHFQPSMGTITDPYWNSNIVRIAKMTNATIIPMFIHGHNSIFFQALGLLHPRLRTALLPREFLRQQHNTISITIGKPIQKHLINSFMSESDCTRYIRQRTYLLQYQHERKDKHTFQHAEAIADSDKHSLEIEIASLKEQDILAESGEYTVYLTNAKSTPGILREIGRLRELTFRDIGGGTGKAMDLDMFDAEYDHLILYKTGSGIIGGYRIGRTDHMQTVFGKQGLYTQTLFTYSQGFKQHVPKGLELGRAFICKEFQRSFLPLQLLWKGIGTYIAKHKEYRYLFGSVSISNDYTPFSRQLIVNYLKHHCFDSNLAEHIQAKNRFINPNSKQLQLILKNYGEIPSDIDLLNSIIMEVESDGKGIPILIRQYMKLGGKFCGFGIDPSFNDAIDCLVMIDIMKGDNTMLERYIGEDALKDLRNFHLCTSFQTHSQNL
jgi:putative hemolysin